jgi:putative oxidoreductase
MATLTLSCLLMTDAPRAALLVRLLVGAVFVSEGIQKFLFPGELGVGRFAKIGLPAPDLLAPFVGSVEITCGMLVLLGLLTRLAAGPLLAVMCVALHGRVLRWVEWRPIGRSPAEGIYSGGASGVVR